MNSANATRADQRLDGMPVDMAHPDDLGAILALVIAELLHRTCRWVQRALELRHG